MPRGYPWWLRDPYSHGMSLCARMLHECHSGDREVVGRERRHWTRALAANHGLFGPTRPTVNLLNIIEFARRTERSSTGGLPQALAANRD